MYQLGLAQRTSHAFHEGCQWQVWHKPVLTSLKSVGKQKARNNLKFFRGESIQKYFSHTPKTPRHWYLKCFLKPQLRQLFCSVGPSPRWPKGYRQQPFTGTILLLQPTPERELWYPPTQEKACRARGHGSASTINCTEPLWKTRHLHEIKMNRPMTILSRWISSRLVCINILISSFILPLSLQSVI